MKKIVLVFISSLLFLTSWAQIPKIQLPTKGTPPLVTYTRFVETTGSKNINYDSVMKKFMELIPDAKIKNDDKNNCYFLIVGYIVYKYNGEDKKCSFVLNFQGEDSDCTLTINQIKIMHYNIERMYLDKKPATAKKFNSSFDDINTKLNTVMDELAKQLK
jgi:hypothetical protein